jgi:hypothetical protein
MLFNERNNNHKHKVVVQNRKLVCAMGNYQWFGEHCFAGAAI